MIDFFAIAARVFLATIFVAAFVGKGLTPNRFRRFTGSVQGLAKLSSHRAALGLAAIVVAGEGLAAVLLILPWTPRLGFALGGAMLVIFTGVIVRSVRAGIFAECRCFGGRGAIMSATMIGRNVILLAVAVAGLLLPTASLLSQPVQTVWAIVVGIGLALMIIRYYDDLVRLALRRHAKVTAVRGT